MKALSTSFFVLVLSFVIAWAGFGSGTSSATPALVSTGTLTVSTVDAANKPVAGALVNVFPSGSSTPAASGTTNASGKITFSGLAAGNYNIFASKVITVGGFSYAIFGSGSATVSNKPTGVTIRLVNSAP
jgi:hypothetical protein